MILELQDVCKNYLQGKMEFPALKNINFSMDEGEYTAIMGPSGSGKSTLMNIIGCLDKATSGKLLLDGIDLSTYNEDQLSDIRLQKIGFIFQQFQLLPYMTAQENVAMPLIYAHVPKQERLRRAKEALNRVGLSDRLTFKPTQLSGGQKQRVAIARAMINNPKILLADEPTGALDSKSGAQVMELFRRLNSEGVTILMITHDAGIARHADRIVEIRDGELYQPESTEGISVLNQTAADEPVSVMNRSNADEPDSVFDSNKKDTVSTSENGGEQS